MVLGDLRFETFNYRMQVQTESFLRNYSFRAVQQCVWANLAKILGSRRARAWPRMNKISLGCVKVRERSNGKTQKAAGNNKNRPWHRATCIILALSSAEKSEIQLKMYRPVAYYPEQLPMSVIPQKKPCSLGYHHVEGFCDLSTRAREKWGVKFATNFWTPCRWLFCENFLPPSFLFWRPQRRFKKNVSGIAYLPSSISRLKPLNLSRMMWVSSHHVQSLVL